MFRKLGAISLVAMSIWMTACPSSRDEGGSQAAIPNSPCGTQIPAQYCTQYNPGQYPYSPYGNNYTYGNYGYGYYNNGYYTPGYGNQVPYGCPGGYQPMYTGGAYRGTTYTCIQISYMQSQYNQYGYQPYYPSGYAWGGGYVGAGPVHACDPYLAYSCGTSGAVCQAAFGQRAGYCVQR